VALPDGRVAVAVMANTTPNGVFLVFAQQDGHWLIDERYTVVSAYTSGNGS
jgi:hypothetical protein